VLGPFVPGEILPDADQPEDLTSWRLEVQVRIRHVEHRDAEGDDLLAHRLGVVGFQFQVGRLQEALVIEDALILVHDRDI